MDRFWKSPLLRPKFLHFHAFFRKMGPRNMLLLPPSMRFASIQEILDPPLFDAVVLCEPTVKTDRGPPAYSQPKLE